MHVSTATLPYAPEASYLDPTDPGHPEKVCHGYTFVTDQTTLTSGWYVVAGAVTFDNRIYVFGDVNLILMDGAELAANSGVNVGEGNRLTIEPDILECEIKWALDSITTNKASRNDGIPVELFQILKDDAVIVLHSICQQIGEIQQWSQDCRRERNNSGHNK